MRRIMDYEQKQEGETLNELEGITGIHIDYRSLQDCFGFHSVL
jgi:hypothetical protein